MKNETNNSKTDGKPVAAALQEPPRDRMIRRPATTRDVLGRDPKLNVAAIGNGKYVKL